MQLQYNDDNQWVGWAHNMTRVKAVMRKTSEDLVLLPVYHEPEVMDSHCDWHMQEDPSLLCATRRPRLVTFQRLLTRKSQIDSVGSPRDMEFFARDSCCIRLNLGRVRVVDAAILLD